MANHIKPTKEELKAQVEQSIKDAEEMAKDPKNLLPEDEDEAENPIKEEPVDLEEAEKMAAEPEDEEEESAEPEKEESEEEEPKKEEEQGEPSKEIFKKKFSASSRENQKINAKNRIINKALADAEDIPEPTEDEVKQEFGESEYDVMSEVEKKMAKETIMSRKWRETIKSAKDQATKVEKWNDSVDEFIDTPQTLIDTPELEGKTDEFREFAQREENNNVGFKLLLNAFLFERSKDKKVNKGAMFPQGNGGPNIRDNSQANKKLSIQESSILRETNYAEYKKKLLAGEISDEI